ncbi:MAG: hypothetical protein ACLQQ4_09055 [Bacteroidia bacterium]
MVKYGNSAYKMKPAETNDIAKRIATKSYWINKDPNGIIRWQIIPDAHISVSEIKEAEKISIKINEGQKMLILVDADNFYIFTPEATDYIKNNREKTRIASALVSHNLGPKIIVEYIAHHSAKSPLKIFSTEKEAVKWLLSFKHKA